MNELGSDTTFGTLRRSAEPIATAPAQSVSEKNRSVPQLDIGETLRVLIKWKWLILGAISLGIVAAIAVTLASTRVYRAAITLDINTSQMEIMGNDRGGVQPRPRNEDAFLQTEYGLLKSRSLATRVIQMLNLANDPNFVSQQPPLAKRELAAAFKVMGGLEVEPVRGSHLVTLYYRDVDPERAAAIANAFGKGFIAAGAAQRYDATAYARDFLQSRLSLTRQRLETSERELVNYAQKQGILQLDRGGSDGATAEGRKGDGPTGTSGDSLTAQSLTALNGSLSSAIEERISAEQRYKQAEAGGLSGDVLNATSVQALRAERDKLQADYREQLATFQPDYPGMVSMRDRMAQIDKALAKESGDMTSSLRSGYLTALGREAELRDQVDALRGKVLTLRDRGIGYTILQREVDTNRALYDALLERFKEIGIVGGLGETDAEVVDTALPPHSPFKPRPLRNLLVGIIAGLVIGLAAAFGIEFIDDTVKIPEDAKKKLGLPALGLVPRMAKTASMIEELAVPRSNVAEAYYSVMTALQFSSNHGYPKSLVVTSSRAGEGKSSTSLALAQNFARIGVSVLLIDADLRNPSFHSGKSDKRGLSALLVSADRVTDHVVSTRTPRLSLLPSGPIPPNPAELLVSNRIQSVIREAMDGFDIVIVDAPPVLGLADAPILGSACEATLLVVESGSVRRRIILDALDRLRAADARITGVVLTKHDSKASGYGYGYGYGYGATNRPRSGGKAEILDIAS